MRETYTYSHNISYAVQLTSFRLCKEVTIFMGSAIFLCGLIYGRTMVSITSFVDDTPDSGKVHGSSKGTEPERYPIYSTPLLGNVVLLHQFTAFSVMHVQMMGNTLNC